MTNQQKILVTGGAGYIGSHCLALLLEDGHDLVVIDNLNNGNAKAVQRVEALAGRGTSFYIANIREREALEAIFSNYNIGAVVHFAGLKAVGESTQVPLSYYQNNVVGTVTLLETMRAHNVRRLVFSSSATVYGQPDEVPVTEDAPLRAQNPYGRTKLIIEDILRDLAASETGWHIASLRYFNPVGAHPSGRIGECPKGVPNNLMPYVMQVAGGTLEELLVFGDDYPTRDGTGVRDYIHVMDLCNGHIAALERLDEVEGFKAWNLGTGRGHTVLELLAAVEAAVGKEIPFRVVGRRPGDAAEVFANPSLAERELGWRAVLGLDEMCADAWRWQQQNPDGY